MAVQYPLTGADDAQGGAAAEREGLARSWRGTPAPQKAAYSTAVREKLADRNLFVAIAEQDPTLIGNIWLLPLGDRPFADERT